MGTTILNDPERRSALSKAMASKPCQALESYRFGPDVRVVVLRGTGRYFSVGGDTTSTKKCVDCYARGLRPETQTKENVAGFNRLILVIRQIEKLVVNQIEGACADDGLSIAMVSDLSIADESCKMIFAFVNVGLALDMGSSLMLMRRVGPARATGLFMTGRRFTGGEAARPDIIIQAAPVGDLEQTVSALATKPAAGPAASYREIKGAVNHILYPDLYQCMAMESDYADRLTHTTDHARVVYVLLEKRAPRFSGTWPPGFYRQYNNETLKSGTRQPLCKGAMCSVSYSYRGCHPRCGNAAVFICNCVYR